MYFRLTILIPVKEHRETVAKFVEGNKSILNKYPLIVLDAGGGEPLSELAQVYIRENPETSRLHTSRQKGINLVTTEYALMLDADEVLPKNYVSEALKLLEENSNVAVVSIDHETLQGHLAFGTSLWRTKILQELYDWNPKNGKCECVHMWSKVHKAGYKIETLCMRAKHLK